MSALMFYLRICNIVKKIVSFSVSSRSWHCINIVDYIICTDNYIVAVSQIEPTFYNSKRILKLLHLPKYFKKTDDEVEAYKQLEITTTK